MAKKIYNNYDDTLFGQYIRQLENADSAGWDASDRIWRVPQRKGLDKRNRGMGVDVINNLATKTLTKNRPGQYLTEKEEHRLRNEHIQYLLDVVDRRKESSNPSLKDMSPKKQAQVLGIMYRGDAPELWNETTVLGKALVSDKDGDMDKAIKEFYESKGLGERAKNDSIFWNNQKIQNKSKAAIVPQTHINNTIEYQDAIKTYRPAIIPSNTIRDTKKAMQDKVDFHRFMDSISIQNNLPPAYTPKSSIHSKGGFMYKPRDAWEALSMPEKAEMMKVAVRNGITNLQDIREKYNEFAEGGNIYKEGGKKKSSSANPSAQRAMRYFMDKGLTDYQAAGLVGNLMRESGMNPQALNKGSKAYGLAQWLGPRKKALFARYGNNPSLENQLDFIWSELNSTHKNGLRHLRSSKSAEEAARNAMGYYEFSAGPEAAIANMRKYGQDGEGSMRKGISFASNLIGQPVPIYIPKQNEAAQLSLQESTVPSKGFIYTLLNPQVFGIADTPSYTINVPDQTLASGPQVDESSISLYSPEELDRQERMDKLSAFSNVLRMTSPQGSGNVFLDAIGMLTGNAFADGGGIHIKPENRGKFTALKKRTGHSATWFKEHGTPAQKKMAVFALNSKHWKHGLGGNLFDDGGSYSYTKPLDNIFVDSEGNLLDPSVPSARGTIQLPEVIATTRDPRKPVPTAFDGSIAPWLEVGEMLAKPLNVLSPSQQFGAVADAVQGKRNYFESVFNGNSGFFTDQYAQEHPYLTMAGNLGGDILSDAALSKVPELAASAYKGIVQPGMRLFNSSLTLRPQYSPVIQRSIGNNVSTGTREETAKAVEKGRETLLDWVRSPFYKSRLEDEPLYRVADDVVTDASIMIRNVPVEVKERSLLEDFANGVTSPRPFTEKVLPDGTIIRDFNTGLNVAVASDLGENADNVALHELLHYMTSNSKGTPISKAGEKIIERGWFAPTDAYYNAVGVINRTRGKGWQNYVMDQNNALLPKYDTVVKMVMEEPDKAKAALLRMGRTEEQAEAAVNSLRERYSYWYDIQEQRAHLQELFLSKIKPHLKNPNDAAEIETFLTEHPEVLENSSPYKYIQEIRPGSLKEYAGYFASALGTIPFILNLQNNERERTTRD